MINYPPKIDHAHTTSDLQYNNMDGATYLGTGRNGVGEFIGDAIYVNHRDDIMFRSRRGEELRLLDVVAMLQDQQEINADLTVQIKALRETVMEQNKINAVQIKALQEKLTNLQENLEHLFRQRVVT